MAKAKHRQDEDDNGEGSGIGGEYKRPNVKLAIKIYREEVAPKAAHISTIKGDMSDPHKRIKDECNMPRKVLDFLFQLEDMEDAKRDHWLLALNLGLGELNLGLPRDLITLANGDDGAPVVPIGKRSRPVLATLSPPSDGMETDLADMGEEVAEDDFDGDDDDDDDAAYGTAAQAIRAMNEAAR